MRTPLAILLATLAVALLAPSAAHAHAVFLSADPAPGTTIEHGTPRVAKISFDVPVDPRSMTIAVTGNDGARADTGPVRAVPYDPTTLVVALAERLRGTYTVRWRTVSDDGHVVAGRFGFAVGAPSAAAPAPAKAETVETAEPLAEAASALNRAAQDGALAIAFGLVVFLLVVWRGTGDASGARRVTSAAVETRLHRLVVAAAVVGVASALGAVLAESAVVSGEPLGGGTAAALPELVGTRAGAWLTVAAGVWLAVLVAVRSRPDGLVALALLGLLIVAAPLRGHGGATPLGLAIAVHVAAVAAWLGGLVALLVTERTAAARLPAQQRSTLLASLLRRFGTIALPCAAIVVLTGALQALAALGAPDQLATTGYGRLVAVKVLLLAGLLALAARNRLVLQERLERTGATASLRRVVTAELALAAVALAAAGLLAGSAPPA